MAISFPQNPTIGDTYVVGDNTFVFDGALWTLGATAGTTFNVKLNTSITNTAPSNPNPGDIWLNATTGQGLVYFDDGDTQQWVDIGQPGPAGAAGPRGYTGSSGSGGGGTLAELTDVDLTTAAPTNDQVLTWNSSTSKWVPTNKLALVVVSWNTPTGSLGTYGDISRENFSYTLNATATVGDVTYSVVNGSLPSGLSLNSTSGVISGTAASVSEQTTSTFIVRATSTEDGNGSNREFSITINPPGLEVFAFTGADQTFIVPAGVTKILVKMWGAGGGGNGSTLAGGSGGAVLGYRTVSTAENYTIRVGGPGSYSCGGQCSGASSTGGFGGGAGSYEGNGGGGGSFIFYGGTNHTNLIAVAGGGGGGGGGSGGAGGAGGGNVGQNTLYSGGPSGVQGTGGTQVAGYAQFNGGAASGNGGGGGGGYYGGYGGYRAGSWLHVSGGGGSGYIGGLTDAISYQGDGLTPGNNADSDRVGAAAENTAGRVVIRW